VVVEIIEPIQLYENHETSRELKERILDEDMWFAMRRQKGEKAYRKSVYKI
jgi:hypothetical protein